MKLVDKIKNNYSRLERKDFLFAYLVVLFPVLQFLIFWVYVNFSSILFAFQDNFGNFTLVNFEMVYKGFISKDMFGINLGASLMRSFTLWIIGEGLIFPITLVTTYVLTRKLLGHYVFRICYIIPSLMGAVMWSQLICYLVQWDGAITQLVGLLGFELPEMALRNGLFGAAETAFPTIVSIKIVMGLVGNNAVLTGAFSRVPDELYESAELDGASFWTTFIQIAVPCVWSTIATLLTFSLCSVFTADYNVFLFTGGNGSNDTATVGFMLYKITLNISESTSGTPYYGYPAALGVFLTCITLPVVLIGRNLVEKIFEDVQI